MAAQESVIQEVLVSITAPGVKVGIESFEYLTTAQMLTGLAVSMSPETDEDDLGDSREVLIRR